MQRLHNYEHHNNSLPLKKKFSSFPSRKENFQNYLVFMVHFLFIEDKKKNVHSFCVRSFVFMQNVVELIGIVVSSFKTHTKCNF